MTALRFQTTIPDLAPHDDCDLEWWFVQGCVSAQGRAKLHLMAALFVVRGFDAAGPPGAMLIQHVMDEATGSFWVDSRLTPTAVAHHNRIAELVAAGHFRPALRGLALWRHRKDMLAWADNAGVIIDASEPEFSIYPFCVAWNGFGLARDGQELHLRLALGHENGTLRLTLKAETPWLDEKSTRLNAGFGDCFAYQCCPQMIGRGELNGTAIDGSFWIDRQWGGYNGWLLDHSETSCRVLGWDWFGLNLNDGRDMLVLRHRPLGKRDRQKSFAVLFDSEAPRLVENPEIRPLHHWTSPKSGARYPISWRLALPRPRFFG